MNGGETFTEMIPASGFEELLLGGYITSLKIHKAEVTTSGTFTDMKFKATMYKTANGGPESDAEWQEVGFVDVGDGNWMIDIPGGRDLVDGSWDNKFKTFEFYIQGKDNSGNDVFYNNGGEDYKVTFSTGSGGTLINKIQFLDGITAGLTFSLDDSYKEYNFNGAGDRVPEDQLGELSSLCIDQFALLFKTAEGVSTDDVSLQYRIYEDGEEPSGSWNGIGATHLDHQGDNQMFCYTDMMGRNVTNDLEPNKSYVLEAWYQVVVDGEYFVLCKDKESSKFKFYLKEGAQGGTINNVKLTIRENGGEPFEVSFPSEGWPELKLEDQVNSLQILRAEVETNGPIYDVALCGTMYNAGEGPDGNGWQTMYLSPEGDNLWVLDMNEGYELVEPRAISQNATKTFEFYAEGKDASYNYVCYNNGGQDYKVTFTCGEGGSSNTDPIKSFNFTVSCDGEEFTVPFPSENWPQQDIDGQVSTLKILRAEVETDESLTYLGFCWTIYDSADGWQHDDSAWEWEAFQNQGGGHWVLEWDGGREIIQSEWLSQNVMKTLEFFVDGGDSEGNTYKYANGVGEYGYYNNYKVTFTPGEGGGGEDWKIKFNDDVTATLSLNVNGESLNYGFDKSGNRIPEQQMFSDVYSLTIEGFMLMFQCNEGVVANDISLQYKVYEEGKEGMWNRIDAQMTYPLDGTQMYSFANGLGVNVSGLEFGKNYVLEIAYQIVTKDNDYFFLGKEKEGTKFRFYYDSETGIKTFSSSLKDDKAYNLAGQRVGKDYKGIVVTNGRKVLVK